MMVAVLLDVIQAMIIIVLDLLVVKKTIFLVLGTVIVVVHIAGLKRHGFAPTHHQCHLAQYEICLAHLFACLGKLSMFLMITKTLTMLISQTYPKE